MATILRNKPSIKLLNLAALTLIMSLGSLCQSSLGMETTQSISNNALPQNRGNLTSEAQIALTSKGQELLKNIYSGVPVDMEKSTLYEDLFSDYKKQFYGNQYSYLGYLDPTISLRWYWSSVDETYNTTRKNQMIGIVAITWALADLAEKQGDSFERGSFTIKDPEHRLYNFLLDYVRLTTGYDDPQTIPYVLTTSNFAYRREPTLYGSSHHKNHCPESQFGIDVRFAPSEGVLKLCPYDTTHLLFAMLDLGGQEEPLLFVKWEDLGMGSFGATLSHSLGFMHSQKNVKNDARREKDIQEDITSSFEKLKTLAGLNGNYKTIRSMFLKASKLKEITFKSKQNYLKALDTLDKPNSSDESECFDIQAIIDSSKRHALIYDSAVDFLNLVDTNYPNGNNHLRCGNEIILDLGAK